MTTKNSVYFLIIKEFSITWRRRNHQCLYHLIWWLHIITVNPSTWHFICWIINTIMYIRRTFTIFYIRWLLSKYLDKSIITSESCKGSQCSRWIRLSALVWRYCSWCSMWYNSITTFIVGWWRSMISSWIMRWSCCTLWKCWFWVCGIVFKVVFGNGLDWLVWVIWLVLGDLMACNSTSWVLQFLMFCFLWHFYQQELYSKLKSQ